MIGNLCVGLAIRLKSGQVQEEERACLLEAELACGCNSSGTAAAGPSVAAVQQLRSAGPV